LGVDAAVRARVRGPVLPGLCPAGALAVPVRASRSHIEAPGSVTWVRWWGPPGSVGRVRMFVALVPSIDALEDLREFLAPRTEAGPDLRWTDPEQWHLTLAFLADVAERHLDDLTERLARAATRRTPFQARLAGAGAFPDAARARVLFASVAAEGPELGRLATGVRAAATKAGANPGGGRFHPHVTLARVRRPLEATRWLRVLDTYRGPVWSATEVVLVESHLGEGPRGRPRHEVRETFALGRPATRAEERDSGRPRRARA
jgi:RNA 2',3'-cyclic 3'-phosphodiesterase